MSKLQTDKLVLLINRLNKAEKRSFRLYVNRNSSSSNSLFVQLFDLILKEKKYDDQLALKKISRLKKSQLSNLKSNLFKQILSCLRLLERNKIEEIQVREQIDFAKILYEKGLYKECLELLDKAKKQALAINFETLALSILYFEKRIESQHITGSMADKAVELSTQSEKLLSAIQLTNKLSNASLLLYGRYLNHGYVRNKEEYKELKEFFTSVLPKLNVRKLEFYQKLYYFQSYVWFHNMAQDFPNTFKYAQKWVDLFHDNEQMKSSVTTAYLKGIHNLLNALFMAKKRTRFNEGYENLLAFDIQGKSNVTKNEISLFNLFKWTHFLNKLFVNADYKTSEGLQELDKILLKNEYSWDLHRLLVFYYKIGSAYFGIGDLDKAGFYLNKVSQINYPKFREDIQSFARILNLIVHFDKGDTLLISYQVKSLYRYLSSMKELEEVQIEIIKFLRRTPSMLPSKMKKEFKDLRSKLVKIEKKPYEKRPFLYLDIISWLESKIENKPIRTIIKGKLKRF